MVVSALEVDVAGCVNIAGADATLAEGLLKSLVVREHRGVTLGACQLRSGAAPEVKRGAWLSPIEQRFAATLKDGARRQQWVIGRCVCKAIVLGKEVYSGLAPAEIILWSNDSAGKPDRPVLWRGNKPLPIQLSLSHTQDRLIAAVSDDTNQSLGVDLVSTEEVRPTALRAMFSDSEKSLVPNDADALARAWASKEAAYKALQTGEPFYPLRFEIIRLGEGVVDLRYLRGARVLDQRVDTWHEAGCWAAFAESATAS